jgi:hypothetical protein
MSGHAADVIADSNADVSGICFIQKPFSMLALARSMRLAMAPGSAAP